MEGGGGGQRRGGGRALMEGWWRGSIGTSKVQGKGEKGRGRGRRKGRKEGKGGRWVATIAVARGAKARYCYECQPKYLLVRKTSYSACTKTTLLV